MNRDEKFWAIEAKFKSDRRLDMIAMDEGSTSEGPQTITAIKPIDQPRLG